MERGDTYLRESDTGVNLGLNKSYEDFVEEYGEENAKYLWETLHPDLNGDELFYIDIKETASLGYLDRFKEAAKEDNKGVKVIQGDMRLIRDLVDANWNEEEFLVVPPGKEIQPVYDFDKIVQAQ